VNGALGPNPKNAPDHRPHQKGAAQGQNAAGNPVNITKNWLFDTGAMISGITAANAANFQIANAAAGWVRGVGGPVPVTMGEGVEIVFQKHGANGDQNVSCNLRILTNASEDLIGVDQMDRTGCWPVCDPHTGVGQLLDTALIKKLLEQSRG